MKFFNEEEYSDAANEVITSELEEPSETAEEVEAQANETLNWAIQKIEEANLFKHIVKVPVFSEGSAEPAILNAVNEKIRKFAIEQLEELLCGGKKREEPVEVKLPFSENEVFALKNLASAVLKKTSLKEPAPQEERVPTINTMAINKEKSITTNKIQAQAAPKTTIQQPKQAPVKAKKAGEKETEEERIKRLKSVKRTQKSPIKPIAPPVNDSWALASAQAQTQALSTATGGEGLLSALVNNAIATPATPARSSGLQFDPDDNQ